ncbi:unnamed protein product [Rotaria socialis]|uniref:Uncharacterized protein n=2 Tax=Rotaria socialis TaxID=392032 RepID=A0A817KZ46_9BILA|nr:unnamed protein product [Rotaria socialis]CAF3197244.1 unnamed protein product [Rotaria socialis]CAF4200469.1 unnamed protein product [Rotaria socialis]
MNLRSDFFSFFLILFNLDLCLSSICSQYYPLQSQSQLCECEDASSNSTPSSILLKCIGLSTIPNLYSNIIYNTIQIDSCLNDFNFQYESFNNLTINILRMHHCNLLNINDQTFANIKQLEKFTLENSTIISLKFSNENFQELFSMNSFQKLKSLTLKNIHYHQKSKHDKKLNLELLLQQLPFLHRLELSNIFIDSYRYYDIYSIGQHLTYLSLTNTHQLSLLPIEYLVSLERLIIRNLPNLFQTQPLIGSLKKLQNLKYIAFEHNQLESIENLQSNTIDDIDLSSNLIEKIDEYTFEHIPKLRHLTLTNNPLNSIDKNAFCGIKNLERLSIHITHKQISPLDNCILINYPRLKIVEDASTKLQCNCQLLNIFNLKRQENVDINRLFKMNQDCLYNDRFVRVYELEKYLNCSSFNQCTDFCQYRQRKTQPTPTILSHFQVKSKYTSLSTSLYSFFSYTLFLLLSCFLYL